MRGGNRPNAGRPKGVPNKVTLKREKEISASGLTPLDYMLSVLRDLNEPMERRAWAAEKAAPYVHARLSSVEQKTELTTRNVVALPEAAESVDSWKAGVSVRH